ncbi:cupin domain-containing protein [Streptomyces sp. NPDC003327]
MGPGTREDARGAERGTGRGTWCTRRTPPATGGGTGASGVPAPTTGRGAGGAPTVGPRAGRAAVASEDGIGGAVLAEGTSVGGLRIEPPAGDTDVVVRTITIPPGAATPWHHHPGPLIAVIQSGRLTRLFGDGSVHVVSAGEAFVEQPGRDHVHLGHNLGTEPVVLYVTALLPAGAPLTLDGPAPDDRAAIGAPTR